MSKFAIVVLAGPQELARALHGLLYAEELHAAGHEVLVVFDGAGTTWVKAFSEPEHRYHDLFERVHAGGLIAGACEYCATAFQVVDDTRRVGVALRGEASGHPSVAGLVSEGYQLLVL